MDVLLEPGLADIALAGDRAAARLDSYTGSMKKLLVIVALIALAAVAAKKVKTV